MPENNTLTPCRSGRLTPDCETLAWFPLVGGSAIHNRIIAVEARTHDLHAHLFVVIGNREDGTAVDLSNPDPADSSAIVFEQACEAVKMACSVAGWLHHF